MDCPLSADAGGKLAGIVGAFTTANAASYSALGDNDRTGTSSASSPYTSYPADSVRIVSSRTAAASSSTSSVSSSRGFVVGNKLDHPSRSPPSTFASHARKRSTNRCRKRVNASLRASSACASSSSSVSQSIKIIFHFFKKKSKAVCPSTYTHRYVIHRKRIDVDIIRVFIVVARCVRRDRHVDRVAVCVVCNQSILNEKKNESIFKKSTPKATVPSFK